MDSSGQWHALFVETPLFTSNADLNNTIHTTCTFYSVSQGFCVTYSTVPSCPIKTAPICRKTALGFVVYSLQFKIKFLSIKMRFGQSILCLEYVKGNGKIPKRFDMPPWNRS